MTKKLDLSFFKDPACFNRLTITMLNSGENTDIPDTPVVPEEPTTDPDKPIITEEQSALSIELENVKSTNIADIEKEDILISEPTDPNKDAGVFYSITKENIIID